jgi:RNA polymerase sigma factor (sigma-70 family)
MSDTQLVLLDYINKRYSSLKQRLARMLGNDDLASDALHDTWLRLNAKDDYGLIENPGSYVFRMTVNAAMDMHRRQKHSLSGTEVDALLDELVDPAPGPARTVEARLDLALFQTLIDRMPKRRRQIVIMVHWDDVPQREVAERMGISLRTVQYELKSAHDDLSALQRWSDPRV